MVSNNPILPINTASLNTNTFAGYMPGVINRVEVRRGYHELKASDFVEAFRNSELPKLKQMVEDAKMLFEEEEDPDSFGEYQGLQMAYDWLIQSLEEAPKRIYSTNESTAYQPTGHTGTW